MSSIKRERNIDALRSHYSSAGIEGELIAFIDDMAARYAWCDLVVCRSGALTVAELTAAGVASVLVPFPAAVDDHQTMNAKFLADAGAAVLLLQKELTPDVLAALIKGMTRAGLLAGKSKARLLAKPDATARVADACVECAT